MSVEVSVREHGGATEVVLGGVIGGDAMRILSYSIDTVVARTGARIILNLDDVTLVDRRGVEALLAPLAANAKSGSVSVVCRRASAARLLQSWGIAERLPVYKCFEDAWRDGRGEHDATPTKKH